MDLYAIFISTGVVSLADGARYEMTDPILQFHPLEGTLRSINGRGGCFGRLISATEALMAWRSQRIAAPLLSRTVAALTPPGIRHVVCSGCMCRRTVSRSDRVSFGSSLLLKPVGPVQHYGDRIERRLAGLCVDDESLPVMRRDVSHPGVESFADFSHAARAIGARIS
jgi:hypothetical protein